MTTHVMTATAPAVTSDALWRAMGASFNAALTAIGLVQTTDTGQVDWDTAVRPAAGSSVYEVWRFDDALQATDPVFLKIEYGSLVAQDRLSMYLTVGQGSDGAGTITLITFPRTHIGGFGGTAPSTPLSGYASSGDGSMCAVLPWVGAGTGNSPMFIIDRARDAAGAPQAGGLSVIYSQGGMSGRSLSTGSTAATLPVVHGINTSTRVATKGVVPVSLPREIGAQMLGGGGTLALGAVGPVFPWTCYAPAKVPWQILAGLSWTDDPGGVFTVRISGADRTYRSVPLESGAYCGWGIARSDSQNSSLYIGLAILWE